MSSSSSTSTSTSTGTSSSSASSASSSSSTTTTTTTSPSSTTNPTVETSPLNISSDSSPVVVVATTDDDATSTGTSLASSLLTQQSRAKLVDRQGKLKTMMRHVDSRLRDLVATKGQGIFQDPQERAVDAARPGIGEDLLQVYEDYWLAMHTNTRVLGQRANDVEDRLQGGIVDPLYAVHSSWQLLEKELQSLPAMERDIVQLSRNIDSLITQTQDLETLMPGGDGRDLQK